MHFVQGVRKTRNDSNYRAVPKHRSRSILPMHAGWIQNRFIPVESFLNTAIGLRLRRSPGCVLLKFQRHDVLRVPELPSAAVCDSSERAATRRAPVRWEDRFPYHEHTHLSISVPRQELLSCGGPRRQVGQVGDSSKTSRGTPGSASNAFSNSATLPSESVTTAS